MDYKYRLQNTLDSYKSTWITNTDFRTLHLVTNQHRLQIQTSEHFNYKYRPQNTSFSYKSTWITNTDFRTLYLVTNQQYDFYIQSLFSENKDIEMRRLDESLIKTCSFLQLLDEKRAECLRCFIRAKPLVLWLKESMPLYLI
ncbi:hypothetical protein KUTeg_007059 [Tegillarca granosa]|uniref:Uncharacterized protein n=1 Tax=Tegillarca granosa TaxID=220873 RepID=A0ABQ9FC52_TEGGR|nr:hypothetical protein KUTeg_007059 [Tegillarca granosa]